MKVKDIQNKQLKALLLDKYGYTEHDEVCSPFNLIDDLSCEVVDVENLANALVEALDSK